MSDIKLFKLNNDKVEELAVMSFALEKPLQTLIEHNLEEIFGIKFLATEYSTGKNHRGRIDTLGIDEDNCPVIIEYKRSVNQSIISQVLSYGNWLRENKAEFKLLVMEKLGRSSNEKIQWSSTRLLCIANDFGKHDKFAANSDLNIELIRYIKFNKNMLLFELINSQTAAGHVQTDYRKKNTTHKTFEESALPGRRSKFSGKRIYKKIDYNPRDAIKKGHGYRSWELIEDGMTYEEYIDAGGRYQDLNWDLEREWVELV